MSTRAMYTFKDNSNTIHVYKHHDGYPEGGLSWIANTLALAWPLPRFEASEFAASFVAANKDSSGGIRLCGTRIQEPWHFSTDSEYHYVITCVGGEIYVSIAEVNWWGNEPSYGGTVNFDGSLNEAIAKFEPRWIKAPEETS